MQVRVLRHDPPGLSVYATIEPENSSHRATESRATGGPASGTPVPSVASAAPFAYVFEPQHLQALPAIHQSFPQATLILRTTPLSDAPAWLPGPRADFQKLIAQLEADYTRAPFCLWPTANAAVSDLPSLRSFLTAAHERARPWTFLFDPISLLTPAMLANAEDHLTRLSEALAHHPDRWATLLADATVIDNTVAPAPLDSGPLTNVVLRLRKPLPEGGVGVGSCDARSTETGREDLRSGPPSDIILLARDLPQQLALLAL